MRRVPAWLLFALFGAVATVLYAAGIAAVVMFALVGAGCVVATLLVPTVRRARSRRPWQLIGAAALFLLAGALLRPLVATEPGLERLVADAFTLPGYFLLIAGLGRFVGSSGGVDRHALVDSLIVSAGAAVGSALVFVIPAASIPGRSLAASLLAGLFPLLDSVLVLHVVNLVFTTRARRPSLVMLLAMTVLIFVGDIGYAVLSASGHIYGTRLYDLPFLLAYAMCGSAALHPSAHALLPVARRGEQPWSPARLALIGPAVATPFALTLFRPVETLAERVILGAGGAVIVVLLVIRAVSAVQGLAATQRRYEHQAAHDPLTGLPNRRKLSAVVESLLAEQADHRQVWMFFLDLDGFKIVNDSWGHPAGDELIKEVGDRLRQALPSSATVARLGGDEFVIVRRCTEQEVVDQAAQIMSCVERPLRVASTEVVITASMGMASAGPRPGPNVTAESLMRDADTAMYRTKSRQRGRWTVFDASMREAVRERIEIEVALRAAVADGHLTMAYQPIVDLESGRPAGAEALVRWNHPVRGTIEPKVFIPVAEDSNLISAVGGWVLRRSIGQLAAWRAAGVVHDDFWMSINVSPRQLVDGFTGLLTEALHRHGVPAGRVVLEITESVMVEGGDIAGQVLRELRDLGVGISVDDFGTGFSALGYLRRHPVTGVKIDRSFVAGLSANNEDEEICRAVVAMSAALDLAVVAEGVETPDQRSVLSALGVTLAQGWLWGGALDAGAFASRWHRSGRDGSLAAPPPPSTVQLRALGGVTAAPAEGTNG